MSGGVHGRFRSGSRCRNLKIATCATVNESIAPNEYIVARKSTWPGSTVSAAIAENTRIATYGVWKVGWTCRSRSGSCRYWPIENVSRDSPIIAAFVAMTRITAANTPT